MEIREVIAFIKDEFKDAPYDRIIAAIKRLEENE